MKIVQISRLDMFVIWATILSQIIFQIIKIYFLNPRNKHKYSNKHLMNNKIKIKFYEHFKCLGMYFSWITHWSTLVYCKILYVNNLWLEKTKSLSRTCNEKTNIYNISSFEPIQFYIDNNTLDFKLILPISKLNGNSLHLYQ